MTRMPPLSTAESAACTTAASALSWAGRSASAGQARAASARLAAIPAPRRLAIGCDSLKPPCASVAAGDAARKMPLKLPLRPDPHYLRAMSSLRLGVNIDHVATVRNARGASYPDPVRAAEIALAAGADGITAHLR